MAKEPKTKKPIWKRWWVIALGIVLLVGIGSSIANGGKTSTADASGQDVVATDQPAAAQPTTKATKVAAASENPADEEVSDDEPAVPTEYLSALVKAGQYSETMHMSKKGLYDQLTSSYGEQFSKKAAKYALKHIDADWNANALAKAEEYQEQQAMSPNAIHDQLTSSYGEKFTESQADYAIKHLKS